MKKIVVLLTVVVSLVMGILVCRARDQHRVLTAKTAVLREKFCRITALQHQMEGLLSMPPEPLNIAYARFIDATSAAVRVLGGDISFDSSLAGEALPGIRQVKVRMSILGLNSRSRFLLLFMFVDHSAHQGDFLLEKVVQEKNKVEIQVLVSGVPEGENDEKIGVDDGAVHEHKPVLGRGQSSGRG